MMRGLVLAAIAGLALVACGAKEKAEAPAMEDAQAKVAAIRQATYELTDVAGNKAMAFDPYPMTMDEMRAEFAKNERGVWCSGAAYALVRAYEEKGYKAWAYHYGHYEFPGAVNHVTTLVQVGDEIYLQDAYLNFDYPVPFFDLLNKLASKQAAPEPRIGSGMRDVLVQPELRDTSWAVHKGSSCSALPTGLWLCRSPANLSDFKGAYMPVNGVPTLDKLDADGYARDISYLLLYPRAVFDGENYSEDAEKSPMLAKIKDAIAEGQSGAIRKMSSP